eukprot:gene10839-39_t
MTYLALAAVALRGACAAPEVDPSAFQVVLATPILQQIISFAEPTVGKAVQKLKLPSCCYDGISGVSEAPDVDLRFYSTANEWAGFSAKTTLTTGAQAVDMAIDIELKNTGHYKACAYALGACVDAPGCDSTFQSDIDLAYKAPFPTPNFSTPPVPLAGSLVPSPGTRPISLSVLVSVSALPCVPIAVSKARLAPAACACRPPATLSAVQVHAAVDTNNKTGEIDMKFTAGVATINKIDINVCSKLQSAITSNKAQFATLIGDKVTEGLQQHLGNLTSVLPTSFNVSDGGAVWHPSGSTGFTAAGLIIEGPVDITDGQGKAAPGTQQTKLPPTSSLFTSYPGQLAGRVGDSMLNNGLWVAFADNKSSAFLSTDKLANFTKLGTLSLTGCLTTGLHHAATCSLGRAAMTPATLCPVPTGVHGVNMDFTSAPALTLADGKSSFAGKATATALDASNKSLCSIAVDLSASVGITINSQAHIVLTALSAHIGSGDWAQAPASPCDTLVAQLNDGFQHGLLAELNGWFLSHSPTIPLPPYSDLEKPGLAIKPGYVEYHAQISAAGNPTVPALNMELHCPASIAGGHLIKC